MAVLPKFIEGQRQLSALGMTALVDAVKSFNAVRELGGFTNNPSIVAVQNVTDTAMKLGYIVGLGDGVIDPTVSEPDFKDLPVLKGEEPLTASHIGRFGILQDAIEPSGFGNAVIFGAAVCRVNMNNADDKYADVKDEDTTQLDSTPVGTARIQWVDSTGDGLGERWAIVILGDVTPRVVELTASPSGGTVTLKATDSTGDVQGGEVTLTVLP